MKRIVILISGRGSNMEALLNAVKAGNLPVEISAVIANHPQARGLQTAAQAGLNVETVDHQNFTKRADFDAALRAAIDAYAPDLVVLAGFMRILSAEFVNHYAGRLINIHPSLLPAFTGLHTHQRALEAGVRVHGCTVHFVTPALDHGPIIIQAAVPVFDDDDEKSLAARVLLQEHRIFPQAVRWFAESRLHIDGAVVRVLPAPSRLNALTKATQSRQEVLVSPF